MAKGCPNCGSEAGFRFVATERNIYFGSWESDAQECVDSECVLHNSMPACVECGRQFRWATVDKIREASLPAQGREGENG